MINIPKIQTLLHDYRLDGWLFTDFHGHDFITRDFLQLTDRTCTRRLFYYIPAEGEPVKVLSSIEPLLLDHLPGEKRLYKGIRGQQESLHRLLRPGQRVACQYSPGGNVPVASSMDAGLFEYLKTFGPELVSSADLLQYFGAVLTEEQVESHKQAGIIIHRILDHTFTWIRRSLDQGAVITEWDLLQEMKRLIGQEPLYMNSPPFFGIDEHACDPGYEPAPHGSKQIREGSRLIIDIAGRTLGQDDIYYDISWCMNVGPVIDPEYQRLFPLSTGSAWKRFIIFKSIWTGIFPFTAARWMPSSRHSLRLRGLTGISCTGPAITSVTPATESAPIWMIMKPMTTAACCPAPCSPSNRAYIQIPTAFVWNLTYTLPTAKRPWSMDRSRNRS